MWHHEYIDKYVDTLVFDPAENTVSWVLDGICAADSISDEVLLAYCRRSPLWFYSPLLRHDDGTVRFSDIHALAVHEAETNDILMTTFGRYRCCTINLALHPCETPEEVVDELREDWDHVALSLMNAENSKTRGQNYGLLYLMPGRLMTNEPYQDGIPLAPKPVYTDRDKYIETLIFDPSNNTVSWMQDGICTADSVSEEALRECFRSHSLPFNSPRLSDKDTFSFAALLEWGRQSAGKNMNEYALHIHTSTVGGLIFCTLNVLLHPIDGTNAFDPVLDDWNQVKQIVHEADKKKTLAKNLPLLLTFAGYDAEGGRSL